MVDIEKTKLKIELLKELREMTHGVGITASSRAGYASQFKETAKSIVDDLDINDVIG